MIILAMTKYTGSIKVISELGTTPQERGLTTDEFKAKFDQFAEEFVEWFNTTHIEEVEAMGEGDFMPKSGGEFTGIVKAKSNTNYTTAQLRNVKFKTSDFTTADLAPGEIGFVYE